MTDADMMKWLAGFIARTKNEDRPAGAGLRRQGWDAADAMLRDTDTGGGY